MKGKIKKYLSYRGYGFIEVEEGEKDIFFHSSNYQSTEIPRQGEEVEFRVIDTPKGKEAVDVKSLPANVEQATDEPTETEQMPEGTSDLAKLNGVGPKYQELLTAAGVKSIKAISEYAPEVLLANLLAINNAQDITKRPPTLDLIKEWIKTADDRR
jgi:cold shock CspA family protein